MSRDMTVNDVPKQNTVADGVEEYYTGAGEAAGIWVGRGSDAVGLVGEVAPDDLRAVLGARDPRTGAALGRSNRKLPGFDLTFSAPKSTSLLFALGGTDAATDVRGAHDAAVLAALGWLEAEACWVRRGKDGVQQLPGEGFIAAAFRHRTSRAGDPQLHTHVLIANAARGPDGRWSALDARPLLAAARTAGFLYQAVLRRELVQRLGVEWGPVRKGMAELAGVPAAVLRAFSRRRAEIEHRLDELGVSSREARELANLATRVQAARAERRVVGGGVAGPGAGARLRPGGPGGPNAPPP